METFVIARIVVLIAFTVAAPQAQAPTNTTQDFVGAWKLVSWTQRMTDGTTRPSQFDAGNILYSSTGRMCAVLQNSKRQKWQGPPKTLEDATARSSGFATYCARVEVNAKEGFVLHHVDMDFNPSTVGTIRKRWYTFDGPNRLTLKIDRGELQKDMEESALVWERVTGA
jgi:hypothetical protein